MHSFIHLRLSMQELFHYLIHSIPFRSIPFHSISFHSIPFHSIPFHSTHSVVRLFSYCYFMTFDVIPSSFNFISFNAMSFSSFHSLFLFHLSMHSWLIAYTLPCCSYRFALNARSSSRQVRLRVVYFSRGTLPTKKGVRKGTNRWVT